MASIEISKKGKSTGKFIQAALIHRYDDGAFKLRLKSGKVVKRVTPEWVKIIAEVQPVSKGKPTGIWLPCLIHNTTIDGNKHTIELMKSGKIFKMKKKWIRMLKPEKKTDKKEGAKKEEPGKTSDSKESKMSRDSSILKRAGTSIMSTSELTS